MWYEAASQSATLHAIHYELGVNEETVDFLGYDQRDVTLTNGVPVAWDIEFKPIDSSDIEGDVVRGAGTNPGSLFTMGMVRFGETLTMPVGGVQNDPHFALLMPRLPADSSGAGPYDVLVMDGYIAPHGSLAWLTGVEEDAGQVRLLDLPQLSGPSNGQLDVGFNTPFEVIGYEGQVKTFTWTGSNGPGPHIALTTTRDEVTIPDPAALGLGGLLSGYPEMSWMVTSSMHPDVDSATEEYREWSAPLLAMYGIGPLPANFGRYAWAMQESFVFGLLPPV